MSNVTRDASSPESLCSLLISSQIIDIVYAWFPLVIRGVWTYVLVYFDCYSGSFRARDG